MSFVWFLQQTAITTPKSINWLLSVKEKEFGLCEVRPKSLYIVGCTWGYLLLIQASPKLNKKFFAKRSPPNTIKHHKNMPSEHQIQLKCQTSVPCCVFPTTHLSLPYFRYGPKFYLDTSIPLREGRAGTAWEPSEQQTFLTPHLP